MKVERHSKIVELIGKYEIETQEELADYLNQSGFNVTQATVSRDIRELKLMNAQLSIAGQMAKNEEYTIPVLVGGEVTNMSLKIVRGMKKKGIVEIMFETAKSGKIAACIEAKEKGVSGLVAVDKKESQKLLDAHIRDVAKGFGEEESDLQVTYVDHLNFTRFSANLNAEPKTEDTENEAFEVQTARLYKIAKSFIENVKELEF